MQVKRKNLAQDLEVAVAEGIRQRGFHLLFEADVRAITGERDETEQCRAEQIQRFARSRQWIAVVGFGARSALIRRQAAAARVREIWGRKNEGACRDAPCALSRVS
jgi:hypothetical protein